MSGRGRSFPGCTVQRGSPAVTGMLRSSTRHQRSRPSFCTPESGGGSVRTASTSWAGGSAEVERDEEGAYPDAVAAAGVAHRGPPGRDRDAQFGDESARHARCLNSVTSRIIDGTRAGPGVRRAGPSGCAGVGSGTAGAREIHGSPTPMPGTPAIPRAAPPDPVRSGPAGPPRPAVANPLVADEVAGPRQQVEQPAVTAGHPGQIRDQQPRAAGEQFVHTALQPSSPSSSRWPATDSRSTCSIVTVIDVLCSNCDTPATPSVR